MRLIAHSSKWGNMYRHRYYLDGRRINEAEYTRLLAANESTMTRHHEDHLHWFRTTHESKKG